MTSPLWVVNIQFFAGIKPQWSAIYHIPFIKQYIYILNGMPTLVYIQNMLNPGISPLYTCVLLSSLCLPRRGDYLEFLARGMTSVHSKHQTRCLSCCMLVCPNLVLKKCLSFIIQTCVNFVSTLLFCCSASVCFFCCFASAVFCVHVCCVGVLCCFLLYFV